MKSQVRLAAALLGAGLILGPASAVAQEKYYLGASVGQAKVEGMCGRAAAFGLTNCDTGSTAWRLLGGYQMQRNFAVEVGLSELARLTASGGATKADLRARLIEATVVGSYPFGRDFSGYGKLGVFNGYNKFTSGTFHQEDQDSGFTYGLGLRYDMNNQFAIRAEWQRYEEYKATVYSFGVLYKF